MADKTADKSKTEADKIAVEREKNANAGFFLRSAVYILARFPLTRNRYQNWTASRRILVGWLLWLIVLPIIPIVGAIVWYLNDPEGFKKSPWAKGLIALAVVWAGYAGMVVTDQPQVDQNGKYSPIQTQPNGEDTSKVSADKKPAATASEQSKQKVAQQTASKPSNGATFDNCTEAFEAGVFDIKRSDSAYQDKLDRDNDGIACER